MVKKTDIVQNDTSPIWTVASKSLCLLELEEKDCVTIKLWNFKRIGIGGSQTVGQLILDCKTLMSDGQGIRREYQVAPDNKVLTLALRFRLANDHDVAFVKSCNSPDLPLPWAKSPKHDHSVSDMDFRRDSRKKIFLQTTKSKKKLFSRDADGDKEKRYRVQPCPDPDDPATEWMTKQEIKDIAMKPSKNWSEVGKGTYGSVYLEVLGCDDLPNMDLIDGVTVRLVLLVGVRSSADFMLAQEFWSCKQTLGCICGDCV